MAKQYFIPEDWAVTEERYQPELNRFMETIFYTGNGYMGLRGIPEEGFDREQSNPINYVGPIYDVVPQTPLMHVRGSRHISISIASPNWYPVEITLDGTRFDPTTGTVTAYSRIFDLKTATVTRSLTWQDPSGRVTELTFVRFVSLANKHLAGIAVDIRPVNWSGSITLATGVDATIADRQAVIAKGAVAQDGGYLTSRTMGSQFDTCTAVRTGMTLDGAAVTPQGYTETEKTISIAYAVDAQAGQTVQLEKFIALCTTRDMHEDAAPTERALAEINAAVAQGLPALHMQHVNAVAKIWEDGDVIVEGDPAAQQGIRFCVLNMHQNYFGDDPRVNMSAKGLSGPGYGGLYWWDSEIYLMPFFLYTAPEKARNLMLYRYLTLEGARAKAKDYDYRGAMYPWVTIDGYEGSFDRDHGMLENHVVAAIPYAIRHYVEATGDEDFLWQYGVEMIIETARFWASRVSWSIRHDQYVINMVTGPDEYSAGVNNNCYTNYMAKANMEQAIEVVSRMRHAQPALWEALAAKLQFADAELVDFTEKSAKMYLPYSEKFGIYEQDDQYLDRTETLWKYWSEEQRKASETWAWERLHRSQLIKQTDLLLIFFLFPDRFTMDEKRANYNFYEPRTAHGSSLSPCTHGILAAELGLAEDAFNYYLRTSRLDLDDVNGNADQGLHTANTAGSWFVIVSGFGGMREVGGQLVFNPHLPTQWQRLAFEMSFRGRRLHVDIQANATKITLLHGEPLPIRIRDEAVTVTTAAPVEVSTGVLVA